MSAVCIFRRWWDRQNERDRVKKGLIAFSKECVLVVAREVPDARGVRARGIWYGDPVRSRVVWSDGTGRQWRWDLFFPFSVSLKKPAERDVIIERSLRDLLQPPVVADWQDPVFRSAEEVAQRALALMAVVWRADTSEETAQEGVAWARQHGIAAFLSAEEQRFMMQAQRPAHEDLVTFSWRAEALFSLLWALGGTPALAPMNRRVDIWAIPLAQRARESPADFIARAQLRPTGDIADEETQWVDAHWHVTDAYLRGLPCPADLDAGVVRERRYALSWMVGYGETWDQVPVDT